MTPEGTFMPVCGLVVKNDEFEDMFQLESCLAAAGRHCHRKSRSTRHKLYIARVNTPKVIRLNDEKCLYRSLAVLIDVRFVPR